MKQYIILIAAFLVAFTGCSSAKNATLSKVWETPKKLRVPESVMYDSKRNILYVSNINGMPTEKNSKGFIAKVSLKGEIKNLKWITGLNAPKGMGIYKGKLFVTDIDLLVEIDIEKGTIVNRYSAQGAQFLNDIAIDAKGIVYVSDMTANKLYKLEKGKIEAMITFKDASGINGLYLAGKVLYAGSDKGILKVDTATKKYSVFIPNTGGVDGLKRYAKNSFIISDWNGKTQLVTKGGKPVVLKDTTKEKINAADVEYISVKKLLLIPTFFDNRVVAYKVK